MIFNEHKMLLEENELQHQLIHTYMKKTDLLQEKVDTLCLINNLNKEIISDQQNNINNLQKEIKSKSKTIKGLTIGGVCVTLGLALFLILK